MDFEERQLLIESYGQGYAVLSKALDRFPREMWQVRSALDPWTIHEVIVHIADSEASGYIWCRRCIAEPGSRVLNYDESRWAAALSYHEQEPEHALLLFRWLRASTYALIRRLPQAVWSQQIDYAERGATSLEEWLRAYERHVPEHVGQMQRIYESLREEQK